MFEKWIKIYPYPHISFPMYKISKDFQDFCNGREMKSEISGMNQVFVSLCQQYGNIGCGVSSYKIQN